MYRILVLCTGNTCRSPMAEVLFQDKIKKSGNADRIKVLSAGVAASADMPASGGAVRAMDRRKLDLSGHRSRILLDLYVEKSDLILTMTGGHKRAVLTRWPQGADRIYTLAEYAGDNPYSDVADPFGGDDEEYETVAAELENLVERIWPKVLAAAEKTSNKE